MNSHTLIPALSLFIFSAHSVLADSHLSSINLRPGPDAASKTNHKSLALHDSLGEIYKRKHNVDEKVNLHPSRTDLLAPGKSHPVDDFLVYYPEQAKVKENKKEQQQEHRIPILLGSIGTGLNAEANASLELFPGSLSGVLDSVANYFKQVRPPPLHLTQGYSRLSRNLHNFFEAVDENVKKGNRNTIFDIDDFLF